MALLTRAETCQSGMLSLLRFLKGEEEHRGRLSPTLFPEALRAVGCEMANTGDPSSRGQG